MSESPKEAMREITIAPDCNAVGRKIVDLAFPKSAIIAMIKRSGQYITPNGSTSIEPGDVLIVLSDSQEGVNKVNEIFTTSLDSD
jgi:cell volume regulation protein A